VAAKRDSNVSAGAASSSSPTPSEDQGNAVPPFITKLLAMINDPDTDQLIQWSEVSESKKEGGRERKKKKEYPRL
jgi:hypothetical protein